MITTKNNSIDSGWRVSYFQRITGKAKTIHLKAVLEMIKNGEVATQIEKIRQAKQKNDSKLADSLKRQLPAFTPSGVFAKGHRKEDLQIYNALIILDIDI